MTLPDLARRFWNIITTPPGDRPITSSRFDNSFPSEDVRLAATIDSDSEDERTRTHYVHSSVDVETGGGHPGFPIRLWFHGDPATDLDRPTASVQLTPSAARELGDRLRETADEVGGSEGESSGKKTKT